MSNKFIVGNTYKLSEITQLTLAITMQVEYSGDAGVFKVDAIRDDGAIVYTDDITSPHTPDRCEVPADIVSDCILIRVGGKENGLDLPPPVEG